MGSIAAAERRRSALTAIVAAMLVGAVQAGEPIFVKKSTRSGQEVLVRGFAEFDVDCHRKRVQTIAVAVAPQGGSVETRPGEVVIGPNWVGGGHCEGTKLNGVRVYYVPAPGFRGTDRFALDVGYSAGQTVRAEVEVDVR